MDKFITYKEQELKDSLEWIKTYVESIIEICDKRIDVEMEVLLDGLCDTITPHDVKSKALLILKQLEDFNLNS